MARTRTSWRSSRAHDEESGPCSRAAAGTPARACRRLAASAATTRIPEGAGSAGMTRRFTVGTVLALGAVMALAGCVVPEESAAPDDEAHEEKTHIATNEADLAWTKGPDSLPEGARMAVLSGDPGQPGVFTLRFEVPAGYTVPPHTHPRWEHVTVLSGTAYLGEGTMVDRSAAKELSEGAFFALPPGMTHYFVAGDEPVVIQLHGEGPWGIDYADPKDDPRGADAPS